jgi:tetratricopeptide (TPR) repeat protein
MPEQPRGLQTARTIDGLCVVGIVALTFLLGCFRQRDADIWWHLKTGQMILERSELPRHDWFTFTCSDNAWIDLHWLFQIGVATLYRLGGMAALVLASSAIGAAAIAVMMGARRPGWSMVVSAACWLPVLFLYSGRLYVRPEVLTLFCMAVFLTVLFRSDRQPRLLWALPIVQLFWVNVQGLFVLGLVLAGAFWADGVWRRVRAGTTTPSLGARTLLGVTLVVSSLVNPYTVRGLFFPIELFRKMSSDATFYSSHISELQSIRQFIAAVGWQQFYLVMHLGLLGVAGLSFVLVWYERRFDLFRLLTFGAFAWLGLQATRNSGQFALVAGAVLAWNVGEWAALRRKPIESQPEWSRTVWSGRVGVAAAIAGCIALVGSGRFYALGGEGRLLGLGEHPLWHAHDAARFAARPGMPDRLIAFHLGHAAVFEFHKRPEQRTFCDPRLEVVSREVLAQYHAIEESMRFNRGGWQSTLDRLALRAVLTDHRAHFQLEATLLADPHWLCVYFDPVAAVFLQRRAAESAGAPAVDFAARLFGEYTGDAPLHEAEAIMLVARGLAERPGANPMLVRTLALLGAKLARNAQPRSDDDRVRVERTLGQAGFYLASLVVPAADDGALGDDLFCLFDLAQAQAAFERACLLREDDFISLSFLYMVAKIRGDRVEQLRLSDRLLGRSGSRLGDKGFFEQIALDRQALRAQTDPPTHRPLKTVDLDLSDRERSGDAAMAAGRIESAAEAYRGVLNETPDAGRTHAALARSLLQIGDAAGVVAEAEAALRDPELNGPLRRDLQWMIDLARPHQRTAP